MIQLDNISLPLRHPVVNDQPITLYEGQLCCIVGPSGCGKTTFLYLLGLMDNQCCTYEIDGYKLPMDDEEKKAKVRREVIGYVFQDSQMMDYLSIEENLMLAAQLAGLCVTTKDVRELLDLLELENKTGKELPEHLSGGQKQRVAIAIALMKQPRLLILDEPTSALDEQSAKHLMKLLKKIALEKGVIIMIASHSTMVIDQCDSVYAIENYHIRRIKESTDFIDKELLPNRQPLFRYINYVLMYDRKFIKTKVILTLLCSLVIAFVLGSIVATDDIVARQMELMTQYSNTEIVINHEGWSKTYDPSISTFTDEELKYIQSIKGIKTILPFEPMYAVIDGVECEVEVQPYIPDMNLDVFKKDTKDIYSSYELDQKLTSKNLNVQIALELNGKTIGENVTITSHLDSLYLNKYGNSRDVLYVPYDTYKKWQKELITIQNKVQTNPRMLLVYADQYATVYTIRETLEEVFPNAYVNSQFIDIKGMNEGVKATQMYLTTAAIGLYVITVGMLSMIYTRSIVNREQEFCLLRVNGLGKKDIAKIVGIDIGIQSVLFYVTAICVLGGVNIILSLLKNDLTFRMLPIITSGVGLSLVTGLIPLWISLKKVNKLSPAEFFRK